MKGDAMKLFIATVAATLPLLVIGSTAHATDIAAGRWGGLKPHPRFWSLGPNPLRFGITPNPRGYLKPNPRSWGDKPNPRMFRVKANPRQWAAEPNPRGWGPIKPNPKGYGVKPHPRMFSDADVGSGHSVPLIGRFGGAKTAPSPLHIHTDSVRPRAIGRFSPAGQR
jgi:hypothetical protein